VDALTLGSPDARRVVLFAAGAGGDPERHRPLLKYLAAGGAQVVAPYYERIVPAEATAAQLLARPNGLLSALREHGAPELPVAVIGHSIGGWAALCIAGAVPWTRDGTPMEVPREPRVSRLVLFAPAVAWFGAPGALDAVAVPTLVYAGELDRLTPVEQIRSLTAAPAPVTVNVVPNAGHFSFMNTPPPGAAEDSAFDRNRFLVQLARETQRFLDEPEPPTE
jgi:pimeloyl-ACP methyl ester carboxylesterase